VAEWGAGGGRCPLPGRPLPELVSCPSPTPGWRCRGGRRAPAAGGVAVAEGGVGGGRCLSLAVPNLISSPVQLPHPFLAVAGSSQNRASEYSGDFFFEKRAKDLPHSIN
jgi:hypothetical protein